MGSIIFFWLANISDNLCVSGAGTGIMSFTLAALRQALRRKRLQETLAVEGSEDVDTTGREEEDDEIFVTDLGKVSLRSISTSAKQ